MKPSIILLALLLGACATAPTPEQRAQAIFDRYGPECRLAGYQMGTQGFEDCVVVAYRRDQSARARAALGAQQAQPFQMPMATMPAADPLVLPRNCTTTYVLGQARTVCQ